jgi:hypothetical protein
MDARVTIIGSDLHIVVAEDKWSSDAEFATGRRGSRAKGSKVVIIVYSDVVMVYDSTHSETHLG